MSEPTPATPQKPVLTPNEVNEIAAIVTHAPCPGGIPQAQARVELLQKFLAALT